MTESVFNYSEEFHNVIIIWDIIVRIRERRITSPFIHQYSVGIKKHEGART